MNYHTTLVPAKFPDLHEDDSIPPPATRENPGQVICRISLRGKFFTDLPITRSIRKSTPLVSCSRDRYLPLFTDVFTCHVATRSGSTGSRRENEPSPHRNYGNPHHFQSGLNKLDNALNDVITMIEQEATNPGPIGNEDDLLIKFKGWRQELNTVRSGVGDRIGHSLDTNDGVPAERGGIFAD